MIKAIFIFGTDAVRHYEETGKIPAPETFNDTGCLVIQKEFFSKEQYDAYIEGLEDGDGFNAYTVAECEETEEQPSVDLDEINSSIIRLATELAEKALVDRHNLLPDGLYDGEEYKEEFQDEFNKLYDSYYDQLNELATLRYELHSDGSSGESDKRELWAFLFPIERMDRNASDGEIVVAYEREGNDSDVCGVEKLTPDEFACRCNDGAFSSQYQWVRFIEL
jgi:hypothetical protein